MSLMKHRYLVLALVLALLMTFAVGCQDTAQEPEETPPVEEEIIVEEEEEEEVVEQEEYAVETYIGEADGHNGIIRVEVEVSTEPRIINVEVVEHSETEGIGDGAINNLPALIVETQDLDVDVVSGATVSSEGIVLAVRDALDKAGIDIASLQKVEVSRPANGTVSDMETDVVVVGAGAAGLSAAVAASEKGANVVLLEKMAAVGGTANFAEGIFAVESRIQRDEHVNITRDEAFELIMTYSHWRAEPRVARAFVDKSADTIKWLQDNGVGFKHLTTNNPGGIRTWHIFDGRGASMAKALESKAVDHNVQVLYETTGKKLIMDDNNQVAGVVAYDKDGNQINISSKAVIIATGGFANNPEMLAEHTNAGNAFPVGSSGKMGEGILMAWEIGADKKGEDVLQLYRPGIPGEPNDTHLSAAVRQAHLWVNIDGERFADETVIFEWPYAGNALANQPEGLMYVVFDSNTKQYMIDEGIDIGVGVMVPVGTRLDELESELEKGISQGNTFRANSIEELAGMIGVDVAAFKDSVDQYNRAYNEKHDRIFAKEHRYIQPITEGPFYAIRSQSSFLGTLGGLKINYRSEVINTENRVIPGLYAAGNDAGGMYGDSYDLTIPGGTIGFAVNSGRTAGENAVQFISR